MKLPYSSSIVQVPAPRRSLKEPQKILKMRKDVDFQTTQHATVLEKIVSKIPILRNVYYSYLNKLLYRR